MLIDKYLPEYTFNELHAIEVKGLNQNVYQQMLQTDFSKSFSIRTLFRLRGIRAKVYSIESLTNIGFIKLDEDPGKEILFGIITNSAMFNNCHALHTSAEFIADKSNPSIKAVINFHVESREILPYLISTETRVWCSSAAMKRRFGFYWFFVKPFSKFIRRKMLIRIKRELEK